METERERAFRRNERLEALLTELNSLLAPVEEEIAAHYRMPRHPVLFVVSPPRSGSTLMMQWLAATGAFAYPSNLISRFYRAPAVGARIQLLLTSPAYSFRDELYDLSGEIAFTSSLGKTKGALQPNEFWYFWRRFIPNEEPRRLTEEELAQVDGPGFAAELAALEAVFDRPLALKGLILELNLPFLSGLLDRALFLYIRRHPLYNIQSMLQARERYFGDRRQWYSIKPPNVEELKRLDPIAQIAGQVYYTNQGIEEGLRRVADERQIAVTYEQFCADPAAFYHRLRRKLAQQGADLPATYGGPPHFQTTNDIRLPPADVEQIVEAYARFSGERPAI